MIQMIDHNTVLLLYGFFVGTPWLSVIAVFFARWFPYILIILAALYALLYRRGEGVAPLFIRIFLPAVIAWFLVDAIKFFSPFPRPFMELGLIPLVSVSDPLGSFPSGHATAFAALGMTIWFRDKKIGSLFLAAAALVGLARVAAGVHHPLDILAGLLFGAAIAFFFHGFFRKPKIGKGGLEGGGR